MQKGQEERMELTHEAEPGYKAAYYIVFTITAAYLALILFLAR
jgi:hypothetical protein